MIAMVYGALRAVLNVCPEMVLKAVCLVELTTPESEDVSAHWLDREGIWNYS